MGLFRFSCSMFELLSQFPCFMKNWYFSNLPKSVFEKILYIQYRTIVHEKSFEIVIDANRNLQD